MNEDIEKYPLEALGLGTYVRAHRLDQLGIITDAFYGPKDEDGKKIIVYTILLFPNTELIRSKYFSYTDSTKSQYYVTNEYEYEVTAYLMISPVDLDKLEISIEEIQR